MAKKVAVLAVNPVNGSGLFQYLEAFFENGIPYKVYAVADTEDIMTNSGIAIRADDTVANLKGKEDRYDALVFACGDAIPKFAENASTHYNQDLIQVIKSFGDKGKILIGHCAAGLMFDTAGVVDGKKLAQHPYIKGAIRKGVATDDTYAVDGNVYTAQTENFIGGMIDTVVKALK